MIFRERLRQIISLNLCKVKIVKRHFKIMGNNKKAAFTKIFNFSSRQPILLKRHLRKGRFQLLWTLSLLSGNTYCPTLQRKTDFLSKTFQFKAEKGVSRLEVSRTSQITPEAQETLRFHFPDLSNQARPALPLHTPHSACVQRNASVILILEGKK